MTKNQILICDDSGLIRMMISDIAKNLNYEPVEAKNANEAIRIYKENKPRLVFMDVILDGKNGIEAMKEIKDFDPNAKVIICTSLIGQESILKKAEEFGADEYITKPFKSEEIISLIKKYGVAEN